MPFVPCPFSDRRYRSRHDRDPSRSAAGGWCRPALAILVGLVSAGVGAQELTVKDGLQLWLKADAGVTAEAGGAVTGWADQSGKDNHAAQVDTGMAPTVVGDTLNGKAVLRFDGVDDYLEVQDSDSLSNAGDLTTFFVVKFDDFATYRAVWAKTAVNLPGATDYYALPNTGVPRLYRGNGTGTGLASFDGAALRAGTYLVAGFGIEGNQASHFLAAQPTASGTLNADVADADTPLLIGTRQDFVTRLKGDLAEVLIYDRALSAQERSAVVDYLARKYAIQNLPPTISLARTPSANAVDVGTTLTLTATATDPDGRVERVEFLANGSVFATATAAPYRVRVTLETPGEYRLAARVTDDKDARVTSPEAAVTATGAGGTPTLGVTANLQLWLRADAGVTADAAGSITSWADQSGKANHAAPTDAGFAPIRVADGVAGLPVVRFDGVDDYLEIPDSDSLSIAGDITSLFVVKMTDFATFRGVWAKTQVNQPAPNDYYTLPGSGVPRLYRGNAQGSLGFVDGGAALTADAWQLAGFASTGGNVVHVLNGNVTGTGVITATPADLDTPLKIGTRDDFVTVLKGDLAELLVYDAGLSSTDLRSAQLYLAAKYRIGVLTPTNTAPQVVITTPTTGTTLAAPATVTIEATASDADGSVARVDFFVNGALIATDTTSPYSTSISIPAADESVLTAVAVDNLGARAASAPVGITVTSTTTVPLPAGARLKLWLAADQGVTNANGTVSGWADQSGNANHAAATGATAQPQWVADAINGKPALRFDGEDDSLEVAHSLGLAMVQDMTSFFVVKVDDFDTFRAVWAKTDGNQPRSTDFYVVPSTGLPRVLRGGSGAGSVDGVNPLVAGEYAIVAFDMVGNTLHHYLNGEPNGEGVIGGTFLDAGKPLRIGTRDDGGTRLRGELAELILYNTALGAADRSAVFSYLGSKYGITVPAGPPVLNIGRAAGANQVTISWAANLTDFVLQSATSLPSGNWQPVPGVVNNRVTVPAGSGNAFYRLFKP